MCGVAVSQTTTIEDEGINGDDKTNNIFAIDDFCINHLYLFSTRPLVENSGLVFYMLHLQ